MKRACFFKRMWYSLEKAKSAFETINGGLKMNNTNLKIAITCFFGALVGALVALQMNHHFWWIGVLVGAAVGYLTHNPKEIPTAARAAWAQTKKEMLFLKKISFKTCWNYILGAGGVLAIIIGVISVSSHAYILFNLKGFSPSLAGIIKIFYIYGSIYMIVTAFFCYHYISEVDGKIGAVICSVACTPVITPILMIIGAICFFCFGLWMLAKFGWKVFCFIHSDIRLLCATDSAIGAALGYWCGSAIIGGLIGAICGVINYQLISVRWMKLISVPVQK